MKYSPFKVAQFCWNPDQPLAHHNMCEIVTNLSTKPHLKRSILSCIKKLQINMCLSHVSIKVLFYYKMSKIKCVVLCCSMCCKWLYFPSSSGFHSQILFCNEAVNSSCLHQETSLVALNGSLAETPSSPGQRH